MGTLLSVDILEPESSGAADAAFKEVAELESWMSTFQDQSEVSRLNAGAGSGPVNVGPGLWSLLNESARLYEESSGAFDPSYSSEPGARGFSKIILDPKNMTASLPKGGRLDFGGIGKGWALERAARRMKENGVKAAVLDFGGQILSFGPPDQFQLVEVPDPACRRSHDPSIRAAACIPAAFLKISNASVSTSGNAERPGHIIDPASGRPILNAFRSLTVVAPDGTQADAWSTALFVSGIEKLPKMPGFCALETVKKGASRISIRWHGECEQYRAERSAPKRG